MLIFCGTNYFSQMNESKIFCLQFNLIELDIIWINEFLLFGGIYENLKNIGYWL